MKKTMLFLFGLMLVLGCKETKEQSTSATDNKETINSADSPEKTEKQSDGLTLLKGDFLYLADAAVLQTHREVYGVVIDEKMHELNSMASPYKKADTDMVPVEVRAKIFPKPDGEEGWDYRIEIKEILNVSEPKADGDDVIKLGN